MLAAFSDHPRPPTRRNSFRSIPQGEPQDVKRERMQFKLTTLDLI
jgi:hypothetical protein